MSNQDWVDVGAADELARLPLQPVQVGRRSLALSCVDGVFAAVDGLCNHVGGPLGEGRLDGEYVVCPWHFWKFHRTTGQGEPGYEADAVPSHAVKLEGGRVLVNASAASKRSHAPHPPHALAREPVRADGPLRVLGIGTTAMTADHPRYSTSDALLESALAHAAASGCEQRLLRLRDLSFRECEGFYSKNARACTWPCSITLMDPADEMDQVYEGVVHWADVILVATPIRWGTASSLYHKMVERMNCIQNQETIAGKHLLKGKVAGFLIIGGQDNVQGVAGQMLNFFAEVGCQFPQYPYIGHSRGWNAEDMQNNVTYVQQSVALHDGARALLDRCLDMAQLVVGGQLPACDVPRGGRKAGAPR